MDWDSKGKTILAVCAHPDDLDFGCAASMARWANEGASCYYLILTDGSKGYEDHTLPDNELIEIRRKEQRAAGQILGLKDVFFFDFIDGELEINNQLRKQIVKVIRQIKPDAVITLDPTRVYDANSGFINHPDHRVAGQATLDAVFPFARNSRSFPDLMNEELEPHIVKDVFLINYTNFENLNFFVDVTETMDQKGKALKQHVSQHEDQQIYQDFIYNRAEEVGKKAGFKYAEGFIRVQVEK